MGYETGSKTPNTRNGEELVGKDKFEKVMNSVAQECANGMLTCPKAFALAKQNQVPPIVIGEAANRLKIKIHKCQIGCF